MLVQLLPQYRCTSAAPKVLKLRTFSSSPASAGFTNLNRLPIVHSLSLSLKHHKEDKEISTGIPALPREVRACSYTQLSRNSKAGRCSRREGEPGTECDSKVGWVEKMRTAGWPHRQRHSPIAKGLSKASRGALVTATRFSWESRSPDKSMAMGQVQGEAGKVVHYLKAIPESKWANPQEGRCPQGRNTDKAHEKLLHAYLKNQIPKCLLYFWLGQVEWKKTHDFIIALLLISEFK